MSNPGQRAAPVSPFAEGRALRLAEVLVVVVPCLWLAWAAVVVRVELYDGFDSICNTRFLLGDSDILVAHRCPFTSLLLIPAHLAGKALSLHPRDVRPYHVAMACLQTAYLVGLFLFVRKRLRDRLAALIAFVAGFLNFVYFSFAPFVDHDLYPGAILLMMLVAADAYWRRPRWSVWTALVFLGASAALVKQTYGVFWVMLLACGAWRGVRAQRGTDRDRASKTWMWLAGGSVASAAVYWLIMGWVLSGWIPDEPMLLRPLRQITRLLQRHEEVSYYVPAWIYVRNMGFYGLVSMFLVIPGVVMALKSRDAFRRSVGLSWIIGFVVLHVVSIRAVRYMAFLMPLSVILIAPQIEWVLKKRAYAGLLVLVLLVDMGLAANEALRLREPFYQESMLDRFLEPVDDPERPPSCVFTTDTKLCVMPGRDTPFAGGLYHRLFHFRWYHIRAFGSPSVPVKLVSSDAQLRTMAADDPRSALVFANRVLQYPVSLSPAPPKGLSDFAMHCCRSAELPARWVDVPADAGNGQEAVLSVGVSGGKSVTVLRCPQLSSVVDTFLFPCLARESTGEAWPLVPLADGAYEVAGLTGDGVADSRSGFSIRGYRTERLVTGNTDGPGVVLLIADGATVAPAQGLAGVDYVSPSRNNKQPATAPDAH